MLVSRCLVQSCDHTLSEFDSLALVRSINAQKGVPKRGLEL